MNNGPKSFKDMIFPPSRGNTNAIYAPLPPPPPPRTITNDQLEIRNAQLKQMRKFVNDERCPLCEAQLEGAIGYDKATLYCSAFGEKEYKVHYKYGLWVPHWSVATLYTTHFGYEIENAYLTDSMYKNVIYKLDLSLNERYQQRDKKSILEYEGDRLFIGKDLNEEKLLDKIKLYTLFS